MSPLMKTDLWEDGFSIALMKICCPALYAVELNLASNVTGTIHAVLVMMLLVYGL